MARPGRKPLAMPTKARIAYLPEDLSAEVDLILADPLKQKVIYGSFSALVSQLLRQWVSERRKDAQSPEFWRGHTWAAEQVKYGTALKTIEDQVENVINPTEFDRGAQEYLRVARQNLAKGGVSDANGPAVDQQKGTS